jgi:hypothetical protein
LSVEAVHDSVADVWVTELAARPLGVDGGCVSVHEDVERETLAVPDTLPAASKAATPNV